MEEGAMRVGLLTAGFLLTSAIVSNAAIVNMSPPPSSPPPSAKAQAPAQSPVPVTAKALVPRPAKVLAKAKVTCPCDCPKGQAVGQHAQARRAARYAGSGYYNYGAAAPVVLHGQWHAAPNDVAIIQEGVAVDDRDWTGGVSTAPGGVGGGGFVDGYGQLHFANGGSAENGPSYNSYGQSFQFNPSQPGPFQPRLMGGLAPSK
jgi:hypothetical protein